MAFIFIALLTGGSAGWLKDALGVRECHQGQCDAEPVAVLMIYINDDNDHSNYTAYNENYEDCYIFVLFNCKFSIVCPENEIGEFSNSMYRLLFIFL